MNIEQQGKVSREFVQTKIRQKELPVKMAVQYILHTI